MPDFKTDRDQDRDRYHGAARAIARDWYNGNRTDAIRRAMDPPALVAVLAADRLDGRDRHDFLARLEACTLDQAEQQRRVADDRRLAEQERRKHCAHPGSITSGAGAGICDRCGAAT